MTDFLLNAAGDMELTDFDFSLVSSTDELAQRLIIKLRTYLGELFYDTTKGVPYYQNILGKNRDLNTVESLLKQAITEEDYVKRILEFSMDYTAAPRSLSVSFLVQLHTDEELEVNEVIL